MTSGLRGVSALELRAGDYTVEPAEWRRDAGQQLQNLTKSTADDDEGGEGMWHLHDVVGPDGTCVLQVFEDRRSMEKTLQTSGRRVVFRTPHGESRMAFERQGYAVGATTTLADCETGDTLGSWEAPGWLARFLQSTWRIADPGGTQVATATRSWTLSTVFTPSSSYTLQSADGSELGQFRIERDGLFMTMRVTLERSAVPLEVLLAASYGIFWGMSQ